MGPLQVGLSTASAALTGCLSYAWEHIFLCTSTKEAEFNG